MGAWGAAWHAAAALLWPSPPLLAAALSTLSTVWLTGDNRGRLSRGWEAGRCAAQSVR